MEEFAELVHGGARIELTNAAAACTAGEGGARAAAAAAMLQRTHALMQAVAEALPAVLWRESLTWAHTADALAAALARLERLEPNAAEYS